MPDYGDWERRPLRAAILVGGRSLRMGVDKAGLPLDGATMLRSAVERVRPSTPRIALIGECPGIDPIPDTTQLDDAPGVAGPMAGILAALQHDETCDWLVLACDMPLAGAEAIDWLIARHTPAAAATLARLPDCEYPEPLLAIYSTGALPVLRSAVARGESALHRALKRMDAAVHAAPVDIARQWLNINTPEQWQEFRARSTPPP